MVKEKRGFLKNMSRKKGEHTYHLDIICREIPKYKGAYIAYSISVLMATHRQLKYWNSLVDYSGCWHPSHTHPMVVIFIVATYFANFVTVTPAKGIHSDRLRLWVCLLVLFHHLWTERYRKPILSLYLKPFKTVYERKPIDFYASQFVGNTSNN